MAKYKAKLFCASEATILNSHSPLLRLPGEIRNQIYSYLFEDEAVVNLDNHGGTWWLDCFHEDEMASGLALRFVCQQLYRDTALLEFSKSTFRFESMRHFGQYFPYFTRVQQQSLVSLSFGVNLEKAWGTEPYLGAGYGNNCVFADVLPNVRKVILEPISLPITIDSTWLDSEIDMGEMEEMDQMRKWATTKDGLRLLDEWFFEDGKRELQVICLPLPTYYLIDWDMEELGELGVRIEFEEGHFSVRYS